MDPEEARRRFNDPTFQAEQRRRRDEDFFKSSLPPSAVFGQRLRQKRVARNLTQAELARRMRATGNPMSKTALLRIERGERGLKLDEAFALTEVLRAVPLHMLTPPEDKLIRLSEGLATDGAGLWEWLISGLPGTTSRDERPPTELTELVEELERERRSDINDSRLARLARALEDAMQIDGEDGKAAKLQALRALREEVRRQDHERAEEEAIRADVS